MNSGNWLKAEHQPSPSHGRHFQVDSNFAWRHQIWQEAKTFPRSNHGREITVNGKCIIDGGDNELNIYNKGFSQKSLDRSTSNGWGHDWRISQQEQQQIRFTHTSSPRSDVFLCVEQTGKSFRPAPPAGT